MYEVKNSCSVAPRRIATICIFIIVGTWIRFLLPFLRPPLDRLFSDPLRHWVNGGRFFSPELMGGSDPISYQMFIWLVREATQGNAFIVAAVAGALSAIMPWFYYRAVREFRMERTEALVVWAAIALMPSLSVIYNYVMMETLLLPLMGAGLWASARHLRKQTSKAFWLSCLIWILACLTKPLVFPLAGVCLFWTWAKASRKTAAAIGAIGMGLLMITPSALRSWEVLGFPAPLGNPWITKIQHRSGANKIEIQAGDSKWWFVSPSCNMLPLAPLSGWKMQRAEQDSRVSVNVDPELGESDWRDAYESLETSFSEWMTQWGENVVLFLFAPSWPDCNMNEWDGWLCVHLRWIWAPIIFFVLDCNIRDFLRRKFELLPVATTAFTLFLMFQNVATSEGRYRKPLEPLLIMNLVWVWRPSKKGNLQEETETENRGFRG